MHHLLVDKGTLDRMKVLRRPQAFYGYDITTLDGSDRRATREPNMAIDKNAARAALAQAAPRFGAFKAQVVTQDVEQWCVRLCSSSVLSRSSPQLSYCQVLVRTTLTIKINKKRGVSNVWVKSSICLRFFVFVACVRGRGNILFTSKL